MPSGRNDGEISFVTIDAEILCRFVVCVQTSDGNDLHTCADDGIAVEGFLEPELLECHFSSALDLAFVLTAFFFLNLDSALCSAVLKLDLRADGPAFAEIIAHIDHDVREIELAVVVAGKTRGILSITEVVVGIETMLGGHFAIATDDKPPVRAFLLRLCLITHYLLGFGRIGLLNGRLLFELLDTLNQRLQVRCADLDTILCLCS